jgi:hypothetical protein
MFTELLPGNALIKSVTILSQLFPAGTEENHDKPQLGRSRTEKSTYKIQFRSITAYVNLLGRTDMVKYAHVLT